MRVIQRRLLLLIAAMTTAVVAVGVPSGGAVSKLAAAPAVDRGLPTDNLNNAAGPDRSNVAWSLGAGELTGDTFSIGAPGEKWIITEVKTWNIGHLGMKFGDEFSDITLFLGDSDIAPVATGTISPGSNIDSNPNIKHTKVKYSDGSNYESQTPGSFRQLWLDDFKNLHVQIDGGQTYYFAVDGTSPSYSWFNHASNAALSGSPQDGSDDLYVGWDSSDLSTPNTCDSGAPAGGFCDGGWDKSSDINVQIYAKQKAGPPPPPGTCQSTVGATTLNGNTTVPAGKTCTLNGTTVVGNLTVNGTLVADGAHIVGNLTATGAESFALDGVNVDGNGTFTGTQNASQICSSKFNGGLTVSGSTGPVNIGGAPCGSGNTFNGNGTVSSNNAQITVSNNKFNGNLACTGNTPKPNGVKKSNTAFVKSGQCSKL